MSSLKSFLNSQFKIKDLGLVHYFLGLEVLPYPAGYIMNQHKYTSDLLEEFHCSEFSPVTTPLDPSVKLSPDLGDLVVDPSIYKKDELENLISFSTQGLISFSVQHLSQFLTKLRVSHMMAALHVLRYLLNATEQGILLFSSSDLSLIAFSDSDWATCVLSRRSITGFYVTLSGCPISWKSKKQPTIYLSSTEVEYRALRKPSCLTHNQESGIS
ncbi:hypothetical protein RND71_018102 [Anisodus tanguticus]|uniref:Reverse transcriptase Ty1/copia-type domain-containing protein n=1 Tax=Anisodus tanguticus TaxID=243964 RepID=A0AAE1VGL7_9SOLA|nr:hypothetical protein RND71_018102 [Anisodus tanguticus]